MRAERPEFIAEALNERNRRFAGGPAGAEHAKMKLGELSKVVSLGWDEQCCRLSKKI
jgi:hypothetical protein